MAQPTWADLPNATLAQADQEQQANAWAQQQRAQLANQWAAQNSTPNWGSPSVGSAWDQPDPAGAAPLPTPPMAPPAVPAPPSDATGAPPAPNARLSPSGDGLAAPAAPTTPDFVAQAAPTPQTANNVSQFGSSELTTDEAYAACGPAAAVRFAQVYGRNPSLREATDLAKEVGWTSAQGMAGLGSQKRLMDKLGIPTKQVGGDWDAIMQEARTGNPVTISTLGHYFFVDGFQNGLFHVGKSGTDLKGGSEWMTAAQMEQRMGKLQGALFADHPAVPADSTALDPNQMTADITAANNAPRPLQWGGPREGLSLDDGQTVTAQPVPIGDAEKPNWLPDAIGKANELFSKATGIQTKPPENVTEAVNNAGEIARNRQYVTPGGLIDPRMSPPGGDAFESAISDIGASGKAGAVLAAGANPLETVGKGLGAIGGAANKGIDAVGGKLDPIIRFLKSPLGATMENKTIPNALNELAKALPDVAPLIRPNMTGQELTDVVEQAVAKQGGTQEQAQQLMLKSGFPVDQKALPSGHTLTYQGTAASFDRVDPARWADPNSLLYGPGNYTTTDPRVAGGVVTKKSVQESFGQGTQTKPAGYVEQPGYAQARAATQTQLGMLEGQIGYIENLLKNPNANATEQAMGASMLPELRAQLQSLTETGPNVRKINIPKDLNYLDIDAPIPPDALVNLGTALKSELGPEWKAAGDPTAWMQQGKGGTGQDVYRTLLDVFDGDKAKVNQFLAQNGYDGITHIGGNGMAILDDSGSKIKHQVFVTFPDALPRTRNAWSPTDANGVYLNAGLTPRDVLQSGTRTFAPIEEAAPETRDVFQKWVGNRGFSDAKGTSLQLEGQRLFGDNLPDALHTYETTGQFTANPTPEQAAYAAKFGTYINDVGDQLRASNPNMGDVRSQGINYIKHLWDDTRPDNRVAQGTPGRASVAQGGSFTQGRSFPTVAEGQANGFTPRDDVGLATGQSAQEQTRALGNVQFAADLRDLANRGSKDVIVYDPNSPNLAERQLPEGFTKGSDLSPSFNGLAFSQPLKDSVNNVLDRASGQTSGAGKLMQGVSEAVGEVKHTMLSGSPFHQVQEYWQAVGANSPKAAADMIGKATFNMRGSAFDAYRVNDADWFERAANGGMTLSSNGAIDPDIAARYSGPGQRVVRAALAGVGGGASAYGGAKAEGASDEDALKAGAIGAVTGGAYGGLVSKWYNDALFQRVIPTLKMETFKAKVLQGMDDRAAASFVNQTFGGQNLDMIGRSPLVQQVLQTTMLAPDWWEGWARTGKNVFTPERANPIASKSLGAESRKAVIQSAIVMAAVTEGLNYATTGHFTDQNDPDHQFDIQVPGADGKNHYFDPWGARTEILKLAVGLGGNDPTSEIGRFGRNKLGIVPGFAAEALQNKDAATGKQIVKPGTPGPQAVATYGGMELRNNAPIGGSQLLKGTSGAGIVPTLAALLAGAREDPRGTRGPSVTSGTRGRRPGEGGKG